MEDVDHRFADEDTVIVGTPCSYSKLDLLNFNDLKPEEFPYAATVDRDKGEATVFYRENWEDSDYSEDEIRDHLVEGLERAGMRDCDIALEPDEDGVEEIYERLYGEEVDLGDLEQTSSVEINAPVGQDPQSI